MTWDADLTIICCAVGLCVVVIVIGAIAERQIERNRVKEREHHPENDPVLKRKK